MKLASNGYPQIFSMRRLLIAKCVAFFFLPGVLKSMARSADIELKMGIQG